MRKWKGFVEENVEILEDLEKLVSDLQQQLETEKAKNAAYVSKHEDQ